MKTYGPYTGVVEEVHDGDTIYCKLDIGFDLTIYARVRIKGINAPELRTAEGKAAREFARTLLPVGCQVRVKSYGWDKYGGRIDGQIIFDLKSGDTLAGKDFATAMFVAGHAARYTA